MRLSFKKCKIVFIGTFLNVVHVFLSVNGVIWNELKQTNGQTNGQTNKRTNKQTDKTNGQTNKHTKRTNKQTDKRTNKTNEQTKQMDRQTNKQTNSYTFHITPLTNVAMPLRWKWRFERKKNLFHSNLNETILSRW